MAITPALILAVAAPASARDSLGVYGQWAAFRDAGVPRCYAIAKPRASGDGGAFASVATWPAKKVRGQLHIRLSSEASKGAKATLTIGDRRFTLETQGRNAWAGDKAMDAAIIAAMRSASRMNIRGRAKGGARFTDSYALGGVATAMDAAVVGCSEL